ncbi:MAG: hypothetical protein DME32_09060 [Verrucomicrobia bacterium]|nr:MAG: hypothetical protein DME32_09060 [Verrucomicrobiota bacterium]
MANDALALQVMGSLRCRRRWKGVESIRGLKRIRKGLSLLNPVGKLYTTEFQVSLVMVGA